jgi:hypothetical protein
MIDTFHECSSWLRTPRRGSDKPAQGKAQRRQPRSDALGPVRIIVHTALKGRHTSDSRPVVAPLQGWLSMTSIIPRATLPLVALPWADMWLPHQGEETAGGILGHQELPFCPWAVTSVWRRQT